MSTEAGLTPQDTFDVSWAYRYEDDDTLARDMVAVGGLAELAGPARVDGLRASILEALAPYRTADGAYRLENELHFVVAAAP